jgi:hypothetical protein
MSTMLTNRAMTVGGLAAGPDAGDRDAPDVGVPDVGVADLGVADLGVPDMGVPYGQELAARSAQTKLSRPIRSIGTDTRGDLDV